MRHCVIFYSIPHFIFQMLVSSHSTDFGPTNGLWLAVWKTLLCVFFLTCLWLRDISGFEIDVQMKYQQRGGKHIYRSEWTGLGREWKVSSVEGQRPNPEIQGNDTEETVQYMLWKPMQEMVFDKEGITFSAVQCC